MPGGRPGRASVHFLAWRYPCSATVAIQSGTPAAARPPHGGRQTVCIASYPTGTSRHRGDPPPLLGRHFQIASERHIWPRSICSSASFAMAGPIGAGTRRSRCDAGRGICGPSVRRAPASRTHRNHVVAEASAGHALPFEAVVIGLVVRAAGYGAEREHVGHGERRSTIGASVLRH